MWIGSLALAGIYPFAGYYSKDAIVEATFAAHSGVGMYAFICAIAAAFLTAFYSWRLLILTFHGRSRADHHVLDHAHESPFPMLLPLVLLAVGAVVSGFMLKDWFIGHEWAEFWHGSIVNAASNHTLETMHHLPEWVGLAPSVVGIAGIALAYVLYMFAPDIPGQLASRFNGLYQFLLNKWYFDELYDRIFVKPALCLARQLWQIGDATIIDGMPNGAASIAAGTSRQAVKLQTGSLAIYAFSMLIGVVVLVSVFLVFR